MSRLYYKVGPSFWIDHPWDDDTRLAALYLLTSPHRTTEGLFRMPLEYARTDLGWKPARFAKAFDRLLVDGFVEYDAAASVCLIVKALKWQSPDNPNQVKAAVKAISKLPATELLVRFHSLARELSPRLAHELDQGSGEGFGEGLGGGLGDPPTPPPSLLPPNPPRGGSDLPVGSPPGNPPNGNRGRARKAWEERAEAFAGFVLPHLEQRQAYGFLLAGPWRRGPGYSASREELIGWLRQHNPCVLVVEDERGAA